MSIGTILFRSIYKRIGYAYVGGADGTISRTAQGETTIKMNNLKGKMTCKMT